MSVYVDISVSADGFCAGPGMGPDEPMGVGGEKLHEWVFATRLWHEMQGEEGGETGVDDDAMRHYRRAGATVMGRHMFGGFGGPWDLSWTGWWGPEPPYGHDVYVLTHHERDPLPMEGGTTFHFVTTGVEDAVARAHETAGGRDVLVAGGGIAVQSALAAGLVDEVTLHVAPVLLGGGASLFGSLGTQVDLEPVSAHGSPGVTHVSYRVRR
jgi:dihydrofolate reductase